MPKCEWQGKLLEDDFDSIPKWVFAMSTIGIYRSDKCGSCLLFGCRWRFDGVLYRWIETADGIGVKKEFEKETGECLARQPDIQ